MFKRLKTGFKHAFAMEDPDYKYSEEETRVVDKVAQFIVKKGLATPAIVFIKSCAPLNMIGNQLLVFLKPFATFVFNHEEYTRFAQILEHRNSVDFLVTRIEEAQRRLTTAKTQATGESAGKEVEQGA